MIVDIPSPEDFEAMAVSLLNLAWDAVSALYHHAENSEMEKWDDNNQVTDEFWSAAQRPLGNAQALLHQGVELLLKARIAEVSPYLLLDRAVRDWPKGSADRDAKYSEFRTVDAQDLVRLFNTVRCDRLDDAFVTRVEAQRKARNVFVHSVDKSLRHRPEMIWVSILDISHHLIGPERWIDLRRTYLEGTPASVAWSTDEVPTELAWECMQLLQALQPSDRATYLGIIPKARNYICPLCAEECRDADFRPMTAQLRPNEPKSKSIYCFVCKSAQAVKRRHCFDEDCKGNVIAEGYPTCLTCGRHQPVVRKKQRRAEAGK